MYFETATSHAKEFSFEDKQVGLLELGDHQTVGRSF